VLVALSAAAAEDEVAPVVLDGEIVALDTLPSVLDEEQDSAAVLTETCSCGVCSECTGGGIWSGWYARAESFSWREYDENSTTEVDETGFTPTVGFVHRDGRHRGRVELFAGLLDHDVIVPNSGGSQSVVVHTTVFGGRTEYDFFFNPRGMGRWEFSGGVGRPHLQPRDARR